MRGNRCCVSLSLTAALKMQMTRIVVPKMKQRQQSAIVNIGSAAATVAPCDPFYSVYAATKVRLPLGKIQKVVAWHS